MENQHRQITGYRELNEYEIAAMNEAKRLAKLVGDFCESLKRTPPLGPQFDPDQRWVTIATTDLQKGFMALTRAIAKPTTF